mgnify:CR=1 FL=1
MPRVCLPLLTLRLLCVVVLSCFLFLFLAQLQKALQPSSLLQMYRFAVKSEVKRYRKRQARAAASRGDTKAAMVWDSTSSEEFVLPGHSRRTRHNNNKEWERGQQQGPTFRSARHGGTGRKQSRALAASASAVLQSPTQQATAGASARACGCDVTELVVVGSSNVERTGSVHGALGASRTEGWVRCVAMHVHAAGGTPKSKWYAGPTRMGETLAQR